MSKIVSFSPVDDPIKPCCRKVTKLSAVPSVRILRGGGWELGYTLESNQCGCESLWVKHNWKKEHAVFEQV